MKEEVIKKYIKDLDGLLREVKQWEKKPIMDIYYPKEYPPYHESLIFVFGRLFNYFNFNAIMFGPPRDLDAVVRWKNQTIYLEFKVRSREFKGDKLKDIKKDEKVLVVCWEDNWENPPSNIDIIELGQFFKE